MKIKKMVKKRFEKNVSLFLIINLVVALFAFSVNLQIVSAQVSPGGEDESSTVRGGTSQIQGELTNDKYIGPGGKENPQPPTGTPNPVNGAGAAEAVKKTNEGGTGIFG
ncbi:MAG: hypothetical protein AABY22_13455, partial [Nanoarchaeota archaeon]